MVAGQPRDNPTEPQRQEPVESGGNGPPVSSVPPRIEGSRLVLRTFQRHDVDALCEAAVESRAEIFPWMGWCHPQYSRADAQSWIDSRPAAWDSGSEFSYLITQREGGRILGGCGLNQFEWRHRRANLGYWVRTSATGRGVASEAAGMLARMGFAQLDLVRIEIVAAAANRASRRVAEKIGAQFEALARNRLIIPSGPVEAAVYSLLPVDFGKRPEDLG